MRPDFQCGICRQLVPEMYYGGCCALCARIRCDQCMRQCPVCGAQLCPECLGAPRADAACSHARLPPRAAPLPEVPAQRWQRPVAPPPTPLPGAPAPFAPWPLPGQRGWRYLLALLLVPPLFALLQLAVGELTLSVAMGLAALLDGSAVPPALERMALPVAWIVACSLVAARADSRLPWALPVAALLLALLLQRWTGLNELAGGGPLALAAAHAGLCLGGAFGGAWSAGWSWRRAAVGGLLGWVPLWLADSATGDLAAVASVLVHLLLLLLLPRLLRAVKITR